MRQNEKERLDELTNRVWKERRKSFPVGDRDDIKPGISETLKTTKGSFEGTVVKI